MTTLSLSDELIADTLESLASLLQQHYVFPKTADTLQTVLLQMLAQGDFDKMDNGATFAQLITATMQLISHDKHLSLQYSEQPLPAEQLHPHTAEDDRRRLRQNNYGFERAERLPGNIGSLVLHEFVYPELAGETAAHAMSLLADTDGLLIDLRSNSGGSSFMVALIASYLFDGTEPVHINDLYWRTMDVTQSFWSLPHVPGKRFGSHKPVVVLTSRSTWSAAEEFAYSLQALKRAVIVGERTGGGANPGSTYRLNDHFQAFIPGGRAINPITKTNWEGVGVVPDIEVDRDAAFDRGYQLLLQQILASTTEPGQQRMRSEIVGAMEKGSRSL